MLALFSWPLLMKTRPRLGCQGDAVDPRRVVDGANHRPLVQVDDLDLGAVREIEAMGVWIHPADNPIGLLPRDGDVLDEMIGSVRRQAERRVGTARARRPENGQKACDLIHS